MSEIAVAYVSLLPSAKGFGSATSAQISPGLEAAGKSGGAKIGGAIGSVLKKSALGIGLAAGGLLATSLVKGFARLESIDEARAKLDGLGHSANSVDKIMKNALASVKGTAYGLGDAATVAASVVAAGVKPGRDLTKTLKLVADAATIAGTDMGSMGAIFGKVAASNKIQGDVIAQLNDQGIPIIQLLGKELGVSAEKVTELASKGKIDFATFQAAMKQGLGGAALDSGNTLRGSLANVGASLSRIGAGLLGGIFPHLAPMFQGITKALEPLEGKATQVGDAIGKALGPALEGIGPFLSKITTGLAAMDFTKLGNGGGTLGKIGDSFKQLGKAVGSIDFGLLFKSLGQGVADSISVFAVVIGFAADHVDLLAKALPVLVVAFAAYKTAQAAANVLALARVPLTTAQIVSNYALAASNRSLAAQMAITNNVERVGMIGRARATIATIASTTASVAAGAASKVFAAGQWLVNAALTANPIGLVVVAIAALAAGLIYAYKNSETFRNVIDSVFGFLKTVVATTIGFITNHWRLIVSIIGGPLVAIGLLVVKHWGAIKGFVMNAVTAVINFVRSHWKLIVSIIGGPIAAAVILVTSNWNKIKAATKGAWNAIKSVTSAVWGAIKSVVSTQIAGIKAVVGGLAALVGKVRGWFEGILSAIKKKLGEAVTFVAGIPGKITSALGDLGSLLLDAGRAVMSGLFTGITEKWEDVKGLVSGMGGWIKDHKGPIDHDKKLLIPAGKAIMEGLRKGLAAGMPKLNKRLREIAKRLERGIGSQETIRGVLRTLDKRLDGTASNTGKRLLRSITKGMTKGQPDLRKKLRSIGKMLADGIDGKESGKRFQNMVQRVVDSLDKKLGKATDRAQKRVDNLKGRVKDLKSTLADLASSVAQNYAPEFTTNALFGPDGGLISGSAVSSFMDQLTAQKSLLDSVKAAYKKLLSEGLSGDWLQSLLASGNNNLILDLAGVSAADALGAQGMYQDVQAAADALGEKVANNTTTKDLLTTAQKQLTNAEKQLTSAENREKKLTAIEKQLKKLDKLDTLDRDIGNKLNRLIVAANNGRRAS